jgi:hypothetical protein
MRVLAKLAKLSACPFCDFPLLHDEIPLGTEYVAHPNKVLVGGLHCGGCHKTSEHKCVYFEARGNSPAGYLPVTCFELEEGPWKG